MHFLLFLSVNSKHMIIIKSGRTGTQTAKHITSVVRSEYWQLEKILDSAESDDT